MYANAGFNIFGTIQNISSHKIILYLNQHSSVSVILYFGNIISSYIYRVFLYFYKYSTRFGGYLVRVSNSLGKFNHLNVIVDSRLGSINRTIMEFIVLTKWLERRWG